MPRDTFKPNWLDHFLTRIAQLRMPRVINFLLIPAVLFVLAHTVIYLLEPSFAWRVQPEVANLLFWLAFSLFSYDYLLSSSDRALEEFRPALQLDDEEFQTLRERFTRLSQPWGWLFLAAIPSSIIFINYQPAIPARPEIAPLFNLLMIILGIMTFTVLFHLLVQVIQVLRRINRLYGRIKQVNVFDLDNLYALSSLSARIGVFFIVAGTLSYITNIELRRSEPQTELAVFFILFNSTMAVLVFLLPLLSIHRRLADEKKQVARENNQRIRAALEELHVRSDNQQFDEMPLIESQVAALLEFRREIDRISTWPWERQTLRGFITAISLPIVVWLIQQYLARALGA